MAASDLNFAEKKPRETSFRSIFAHFLELHYQSPDRKMEEYDRRGGGDYDRRDARPRSESRGRERERGGGDFRRGGGDDFRRGGGDDFRRGGGGGGDGGYRRERATSSSLLVRNISYRVRPDELRRVFSYYGNIKDVYIPVVRSEFQTFSWEYL